MNRNRLLDRLARLFALAKSSNPHEADSARRAAERLMVQNRIERREVEAVMEDASGCEVVLDGDGWGQAWKLVESTAAARYCGAEAVSGTCAGRRQVRIVGGRESVEQTVALVERLGAVTLEVMRWVRCEVGRRMTFEEVGTWDRAEDDLTSPDHTMLDFIWTDLCGGPEEVRRCMGACRVGVARALAELLSIHRRRREKSGGGGASKSEETLAKRLSAREAAPGDRALVREASEKRSRKVAVEKYGPAIKSVDELVRDADPLWQRYGYYAVMKSVVIDVDGRISVHFGDRQSGRSSGEEDVRGGA